MNLSNEVTCCLITVLFHLIGAVKYSAPEDCDWIPINSKDVSVTCHLQTIVASGMLATNFSLLQTESTSSLTIVCSSLFLESHIAPMAFIHLRYLKTMNLRQCKLKELTPNVFEGLSKLKILSIRSMNGFSLQLSADSFTSLTQLETLDLAYNQIKILSELIVCSLHSLKALNLTNNNLVSVVSYDDVNGHCESSLSELDFSYNEISVLSERDFQSFKQIQFLNLSSNNIKSIDDSVFKNCATIQILDLSNNHLTELPSRLFQYTLDIKEIYLQNNSIYSLSFDLFNKLEQLLILNLSSNYIPSTSLCCGIFTNLIRLVILDISHNDLLYINSTLFESQYSLQMLFLSHNQIQYIEDNAFPSLYNLYVLDLSHNHLSYLNVFTMNGLYVLSHLKLSFNNIYSVHSDAFNNCSSLEDIDFQHNKLNHVPFAITSLQFLRKLNLDHNILNSLQNLSFQLSKQLHHLSLSQNQISNLTTETFKQLPELRELDLSKNEIYNLEHGTFNEADSIRIIDLSDNYLTDINGLFMNLKMLKYLNVSRNRILWFDYAVIPVTLEILDLHSNEIQMVGNYYELESIILLNEIDISFNYITEINAGTFPNQVKRIKMNNNRIHIVHPGTFSDKHNLIYVNMSENNIMNLEINTFRLNSNFSQKPQFAISGNPFLCDCNMEWLQHMNKPDRAHQYPIITDFEKVVCKLLFSRPNLFLLLSKSKSSDFLCTYGSHCFALCHCCDFDACDCEMVCPDKCTCYADQTWNTNIVDCSSLNFTTIPSVIPMDVTDLYLDGNNIFYLTSHAFIGRKNMRVIYLNSSNIHVINNRTFNGLITLQILHLESNQLGSLYGYEFDTLVHLEELYLSYNRITYIANITFQNLKSLTTLNLDHNLIKEFQVWNLKWNSKLKSVKLGYNPWICKCDYLDSYHKWLNTTSSVQDLASIECRYNHSSGLSLVAFNVSSCSNSLTYFHKHYIALPLIIALLTVISVIILICLFRRKIKAIYEYNKQNHLPQEKLFDAFVSYNKKDETFVSQVLAPELECGAPSYRLCLRYRDLPMSEQNAEAIIEAIECSHRTIIVLSEQFLRSDWCRFELKSAHRQTLSNHKHKLLIIVLGKMSFKTIDPDAKACFCNALVIRWGNTKFWEKLRYSMPKTNPRMLVR